MPNGRIFAHGAEKVARAVKAETGLRTVFHHHCAGYVETPAEIARLLDMTDPTLLGLVFDTGHYLYGSGTTDPSLVLSGLESLAGRIWHMHFKDCQPEVAARARTQGWDYFMAVRTASSANWAVAMWTSPASRIGCKGAASTAGLWSSRTCSPAWVCPK